MPGTPPFCKPPGPETSSRTGADGPSPRALPGPRSEGARSLPRSRSRGNPGVAGTGSRREPWFPGRRQPGGQPWRTLAGTAPHSSFPRRPTLSFPQTPASVIPAKAGIHVSSIFQGRLWIPAFAGMTRVGPSREWREWREKGPSREWGGRGNGGSGRPRFPIRGSLTLGARFPGPRFRPAAPRPAAPALTTPWRGAMLSP